MATRNTKSYSKFTYDDLSALGLKVVIVDLFVGETIAPVQPSAVLSEILEGASEVSLDTEKARSELLPLQPVPASPIIAVVEAKLSGSLAAAIPQCVAEMYASRLWNEKRGEPIQTIYGVITNGESWLFLRYKEGVMVEVDKITYALAKVEEVLGVLQHIINQFK